MPHQVQHLDLVVLQNHHQSPFEELQPFVEVENVDEVGHCLVHAVVMLGLLPVRQVDVEEAKDRIEDLGEEVEEAVFLGLLVAVESLHEGHLEMRHRVVVEPDEEQHEHWDETSHQ